MDDYHDNIESIYLEKFLLAFSYSVKFEDL